MEVMNMEFKSFDVKQWAEIKEIYMEAFPKRERKPFFVLKHSVKKGKAKIMVAMEKEQLLGFVVVIPYKDMVMVDYLAVSSKIRSKGTGSFILQNVCNKFEDKKIILLIECVDDAAENKEQRTARRRFYLKNGFTSSNIFIEGASGEMEILKFGGIVSNEEYLELQEYALGKLFFKLSKMRIIKKAVL